MDTEFLAGYVDPTHALLKVKTGKIVLDPGFDKKILSESLIMNFSYFREICATINEMFSLGQSDVLRHLARAAKEFQKEVVNCPPLTNRLSSLRVPEMFYTRRTAEDPTSRSVK
jgi:hypothetical protein